MHVSHLLHPLPICHHWPPASLTPSGDVITHKLPDMSIPACLNLASNDQLISKKYFGSNSGLTDGWSSTGNLLKIKTNCRAWQRVRRWTLAGCDGRRAAGKAMRWLGTPVTAAIGCCLSRWRPLVKLCSEITLGKVWLQ